MEARGSMPPSPQRQRHRHFGPTALGCVQADLPAVFIDNLPRIEKAPVAARNPPAVHLEARLENGGGLRRRHPPAIVADGYFYLAVAPTRDDLDVPVAVHRPNGVAQQ